MTGKRESSKTKHLVIDIVKRNCPLCDVDNSVIANSKYSYGEWAVKKCDCGFVYIDSAPDYHHLFAEMDWDTTFETEVKRKKD